MTVHELILAADRHTALVALWLIAIPLIAFIAGIVHGPKRGETAPWKYVHATIIYLTCIPGILALALIAYSLFFRNDNLLDVSLLVYVLPVISMIVTLILIARQVSLDEIPGFDRLAGLMGMLFVSLLAALLLQKTNILLLFHGSLWQFALLALIIFLALQWSLSAVLGKRRNSRSQVFD